ncbi:MAG: hypothetical protein PHU04_04640 [Candidatus Peribacteraceae bacterium]|nr:hypothetical protein [Candidatus Peribacteraceae bacterium]
MSSTETQDHEAAIIEALGIDFPIVLGREHVRNKLQEIARNGDAQQKTKQMEMFAGCLIQIQAELQAFRRASELAGGNYDAMIQAVIGEIHKHATQMGIPMDTQADIATTDLPE